MSIQHASAIEDAAAFSSASATAATTATSRASASPSKKSVVVAPPSAEIFAGAARRTTREGVVSTTRRASVPAASATSPRASTRTRTRAARDDPKAGVSTTSIADDAATNPNPSVGDFSSRTSADATDAPKATRDATWRCAPKTRITPPAAASTAIGDIDDTIGATSRDATISADPADPADPATATATNPAAPPGATHAATPPRRRASETSVVANASSPRASDALTSDALTSPSKTHAGDAPRGATRPHPTTRVAAGIATKTDSARFAGR